MKNVSWGVVNHVKVSFTQMEWNLAKDGMNQLLKQRDNTSKNFYSIISDINKNVYVFCKDVIFIHDDYDSEKEEKMYSNTSSHHVFDKVISFHLFFFCILILLIRIDSLLLNADELSCGSRLALWLCL